MKRRQHGQAMIEYVVVCAAIAMFLFVPIRDQSSPDRARTAAQILINGFQLAYQRISHALSIPT
jgi:hypothetical protein